MITRVRDMRDRTSRAEDRMFANWRSLRGVSLPKNVGPEMKEATQLRIKEKGGGAGFGGRRPKWSRQGVPVARWQVLSMVVQGEGAGFAGFGPGGC